MRRVGGCMYNYGSEARELEYMPTYEEERRRAEEEAADKKKKAGNARRRANFKRSAIIQLMVFAAVLATILMREAQIDKLCGEASQKKELVENLEAVVTEMEMRSTIALDMNSVEQTAISVLGMSKPDESQYVYIQIDDYDGGEVLGEGKDAKEGLGAFFGKAKILLEYLY